MIDSAIATAADYADALISARRAKTLLFGILFVCLLFQISLFFSYRYGSVFAPPVLGQTQSSGALILLDAMKYLVGLTDFLGVAVPIILGVDLLLIVLMMLVGRLVGVSRLVWAFIGCVVLAVLLFPWQAFLINATFNSPEFKIPGVLYTWSELAVRARMRSGDFKPNILFWARFVAWPVAATILLIAIQIKSRRGLRMALGESASHSKLMQTSTIPSA